MTCFPCVPNVRGHGSCQPESVAAFLNPLLPKSVEPGTKLCKQIDGKWLEWAATFNGTTVQFKVTDNNGSSTANLTGDNDPTPGSIDDPIMIASPQAMAATPTAVPTLSQWALVGLSMLVAFFGVGVVRRRSV